MIRPRLVGAGIAAVTVLAACGSGAHEPSSRPSRPASASPTSSPDPNSYVNPVYRSDFPDPAVLRVGSTFHAYATQGNEKNIQTLSSVDLVHWRAGGDALPEVGGWASAGSTWAPEVLRVGARYAMYYVAHDDRSGKQCIGRATATDPAGPFRDTARSALVCQAALGGSIDPDPVRAPDGGLYLYWKNDGNCCNQPVHLWGQRLAADGARLLGRPVALLSNTKRWQGNLVEAPEMVAHGQTYTLFYSANDYASADYGIGYATCRRPLGPCTDESNSSLVPSNAVAAGPGHCFVLRLPNGRWAMLYHAWPPDAIGSQAPGRQLWLETMTWHGDVPAVHSSDSSPQPLPTS